LGYKEGDMVEMFRDASGVPVIVPPVEETQTPEEIREKLMNLVYEKIVCQSSPDDTNIDIKAMLALDGTGHFTVNLKYEDLHPDLQPNAENLGFKKGETVSVQVDATSWEYRVKPKEKKKEIEFSGSVLEVIPSEEPGCQNYPCRKNR